jgi:hypothetical protein
MQLIGKNKKGGRPAFKPTQRMRDQVEIGSAAGLSHTQLAAVLNISRPTLESNFVDELKNGRARKLLQSLCALASAAAWQRRRREILGQCFPSGSAGAACRQKRTKGAGCGGGFATLTVARFNSHTRASQRAGR